MIDLILYIPDTGIFFADAAAILEDKDHPAYGLFALDEEDEVQFIATQTPAVDDGAERLMITRNVTREQYESMGAAVQVLGEVINNEYLFDTPADQAIYESIYDTSTQLIDDGEGGTIEYTPPYKIGVFL
jgi:hypothetical protein